MADNILVTPGVGATVAADEIAGALHQRVKITVGADGTNDGDVASGNPLPVTDSANEALLTTIDADTSAIATDIAALEVLQTTIAGDTTSIDGKITACNTGAIAGTVTAELSATDNAVLDAMVVDLAALEVLATSIDADTDAIKTAVEVIDNAISGTEMQVDVVASLPAGTNAIGKLAANSGVDIGDVDVTSLVSGKEIKRAVISGATSGNNTIVAAVADKKIKVLSVCLVAATAVAVRFESGADGTALTGVMSIGATGGFILPAPTDPTCHWFETGVNTLLNMELGGAVQVSGCITYYEEA